MGLYKFKPPMSGRMGTLWTLASIRDSALIEYGCMGHMLYGRIFLHRAGISEGCKLYSTHIDETDISLGDTGRLSRAIAEIIECDKPKIVFLLPSSVPTVIGTDLLALCKELQLEYPSVPLLPFGHGGFDVYGYRGVQEALLLLAKTLSVDIEKTKLPTFNIIGSCADMFRFQADAQELIRIMEGAFDMRPLCIMTSDTTVEDIKKIGGAHINLVIRREGEPAAKHLKERFGTPYLLGRPYGIEGTLQWIKEITEVSGLQFKRNFILAEENKAKTQLSPAMPIFNHIVRSHSDEAVISLGGHADVVKGILTYAVKELSLKKGVCWCDCPNMASEDIPYFTEDQWTQAVKSQKKGLLMASGEVLKWARRNMALQIANPDTKWRLSPYESPFVGFRGAIHLADLWLNDALEQEDY
jgi:nitrogenase molybdenum-iron protein alpha/beta subunit